jgi:hypothetical protein
MRLPLLVLAMLAAGLTVAPVAATAGAATVPASASTRVVTIRPVTGTGHAVHGFHVTAKRPNNDTIDCSFPSASPGAVDANIEECSPSAADAIACWKAAKAHHALCMRNPASHRLYRIPLSGGFATTPVATPAATAPLLLVLADGTRCSIRDGGAWSPLPHHPKWFGTYGCSRHGVVWATEKMKHEGVNESAARWTVHTGSFSGSGKLTVRPVKRAYFVGTAS